MPSTPPAPGDKDAKYTLTLTLPEGKTPQELYDSIEAAAAQKKPAPEAEKPAAAEEVAEKKFATDDLKPKPLADIVRESRPAEAAIKRLETADEKAAQLAAQGGISAA